MPEITEESFNINEAENGKAYAESNSAERSVEHVVNVVSSTNDGSSSVRRRRTGRRVVRVAGEAGKSMALRVEGDNVDKSRSDISSSKNDSDSKSDTESDSKENVESTSKRVSKPVSKRERNKHKHAENSAVDDSDFEIKVSDNKNSKSDAKSETDSSSETMSASETDSDSSTSVRYVTSLLFREPVLPQRSLDERNDERSERDDSDNLGTKHRKKVDKRHKNNASDANEDSRETSREKGSRVRSSKGKSSSRNRYEVKNTSRTRSNDFSDEIVDDYFNYGSDNNRDDNNIDDTQSIRVRSRGRRKNDDYAYDDSVEDSYYVRNDVNYGVLKRLSLIHI